MALRPARIQLTNKEGTALEDVDVYTDAAAVAVESDIIPQKNVKDALEALSQILNIAGEAASVQAVTVLQHAKGEGINTLTGLGELEGLVPCSFKTTDSVYQGEALTIDGTSYSLVLLTGEVVSGAGAAEGARMVIASEVSIVAVADVSAKTLTIQNDLSQELYLTLLSSGWVGDSVPYTQQIAASGVSTDLPAPIVGPNITADDAETVLAQKEAYAMITRVVAGDGTLTAYCFEDKPTVDIPIVCQIVH